MSTTEKWTVTRWHQELSHMIKDLTFFYPLPIECSQYVLIESFANRKKDYSPLLLALTDVHYKHLDFEKLMNEYHGIISNNCNNHHISANSAHRHYPLRRVNIFDLDNNNNSILFHPFISMFEFSPNRKHFIEIIARKNGRILSEFVMTNFLFQSNPIFLKEMFEYLSLLEINKYHSNIETNTNINCIYHKIKHTLSTQEFLQHFDSFDIEKCLEIFNISTMMKLLKSKFPNGQIVEKKPITDKHITNEIDSGLIDKFINKLNDCSAPGIIGISNNHIIQLWKQRTGTELENAFDAIFRLMINGQMNDEVAPYINGGKLVPANKLKNGKFYDIRPIIISNSLITLSTMIGQDLAAPQIKNAIESTQISADKSGSQGMVMAFEGALNFIKKNPEYVVLQKDWRNFFNNVSRKVTLDLIHRVVPTMYPQAFQLYGKPYYIYMANNEWLANEEGLGQGSTSSNTITAVVSKHFNEIVLKKCIEIKPDFKKRGEAGYVDDTFELLTIADANIYIKVIKLLGPVFGFILNESKSVITCSGHRDAIWDLLSDDLKLFKIKENANSECLNIPIGSEDYVLQQMDIKIIGIKKSITKIAGMDLTFLQLKVMKDYINISRMIYWFHSVPPKISLAVARKYDSMLRELLSMMGGFILSDDEFLQCSLSTKKAGLGMRTATDKISAIYLPSIFAAKAICKKLLDSEIYDDFMQVIDERIVYALSLFNASVSARYQISDFDATTHTTKWMINAIQSLQLNRLLATKTGKHKAALLSQCNRNANAWLNAPMTNGIGMTYSNPEIRILLKRKLRHELIINSDKCISCDDPIDEYGDHGVICKHGKGIIYKHDLIVNGISTLLKSAKIKHSIEKRHIFDNNNMKPADIYINNWGDNGEALAVDIGVTSVVCNSRYQNAAIRKLSAANNFYNHKVNKYNNYLHENRGRINGLIYMPVIFEDYGGMHKQTIKFIKRIAKLRAATINDEISKSTGHCFEFISAKLHKANAVSLLHHYSIYNNDIR